MLISSPRTCRMFIRDWWAAICHVLHRIGTAAETEMSLAEIDSHEFKYALKGLKGSLFRAS